MARRHTRTTTASRRPGFFTRLRGRTTGTHYGPETTTVETTTTTTRTKRRNRIGRRNPRTAANMTAAPMHHHRRRASMGDKISGAMMKLRGTLTRRPGLKAAGTRRMHGTDGRGARHYAY